MIELAIEMSDNNAAKYGVIHTAGCRDLRDGMPIGTANDIAGANDAADDATGWEYRDGTHLLAPCARKSLRSQSAS